MGEVYFYHLTGATAEDRLLPLLNRALARGWRVAVRGTDRAALERLDTRLWRVPEESFLPHGMAGGPFDADQPVLLTLDTALPNGAECLFALDGAEVATAEAERLSRLCILFDGGNAAAVDAARVQWKQFTGAGLAAQYWSDETGQWEKKAERKPA